MSIGNESTEDETFTKDALPHQNPLEETTNRDDSSSSSSSVQVAVRVRPLLAMEAGTERCLQVHHQKTIQLGGSSGPRFTYDHVFDSPTLQQEIYQQNVASLVESCLMGYNATCLAYGQTGSGKTFTIIGGEAQEAGIIPRALVSLFHQLDQETTTSSNVRIQFLEVYGEDIRDLLITESSSHHQKLTIRDCIGHDEPEVVGASQVPVSTAAEALHCLNEGMLRRVTGATAMNVSSSRSHALFSVLVEQRQITTTTNENDGWVKSSKFNFVDLAGSERLKRTQAEGKRLREGIDINKGLLVLGNVISALGDPKKKGKAFVPYRDSKLTRLLKGSLGGNHKTLMIACVSPSEDNLEESLNCLRYANRAKNIQNNAIVNVDANSRKIMQLQRHVQTLSSIVLQALDAGSVPVLPVSEMTRHDLEVWAAFASGGGGNTRASTGGTSSSSSGNHLASQSASSSELELEITRLRDQLRQSQNHHDQAEEQLYVAKAQKELFELQLSVNRGDNSATTTTTTTTGEDPQARAFYQKAVAYEKEISKLRKSLQSAAAAEQNNHNRTRGGDFRISKAERDLQTDRDRLNTLRNHMVSSTSSNSKNSSSSHLEMEEKAEEEEVDHLTRKYLAHAGHEDDDNEDESASEQEQSTGSEHAEVSNQKQAELQVNLVELSRNIAAKEELIDQLKFSQEKYASMREFYEQKVHQMEAALSEKESEREQLLRKLNKAKSGGSASKRLQERLREKEQHIASLRKKHRQLVDLTAVSSRNQAKINKLQDEVKDMKYRKVDLQKQLTRERKDHAKEVKRLQKSAMQKDRELNKYKKLSADREGEVRRANLVAKTRLAELGQLRSKYRDAEKRLRLRSVKQGVMVKAGLDPVLLGRRAGSRKTSAQDRRSGRTAVDTDSLRDFFDDKVAELVRKEVLVDKLAREWEEHFELTSRKEGLPEEPENGETREEIAQSLDIQIQFKEDRIRQLAGRLSDPKKTFAGPDAMNNVSFLSDEKFSKLLAGSDPEVSRNAVAKVLFGMIVREKRRTAALARTASSLDERLQAAEKDASVSESAFRTYVVEQSEEVAVLSKNQQEHILSLMDMVKEETSTKDTRSKSRKAGKKQPEPFGDSTLLVLANERIAVLEQHLEDLQSEVSRKDSYRAKVEELSRDLHSKSDECESLVDELSETKAVMGEIKAALEKYDGKDLKSSELFELVKQVVQPNSDRTSGHSVSGRDLARSSKVKEVSKHSQLRLNDRSLVDSFDTDDENQTPEWANDIMADLALIADGKMPPSLEETMTDGNTKSQVQMNSSVFDRLADPQSFTGTQKQAQSSKRDTGQKMGVQASPKIGHQDRRAMSREISDCLDKIVVPGDGTTRTSEKWSNEDGKKQPVTNDGAQGGDSKSHRSVFDRLMSPSQYTGTQKDRIQASRAQKSDSEIDDDSATRLLDDLLKNDDQETNPNESSSHSVYSDYTQLNVFERLQKTTTQAYAVKHGGGGFHYDTLGSSPPSGNAVSLPARREDSPVRIAPDGTLEQDVFERLTKTTTEAYANKTTRHRREQHL